MPNRKLKSKEIRERYGYSAQTLAVWRNHCCLLGRPLRAIHYPGRRGRTRNFEYDESDLKAIALEESKAVQLNDGWLSDESGDWVIWWKARDIFGVYPGTLRRLTEKKRLKTKRVLWRSEAGYRETNLYFLPDIQKWATDPNTDSNWQWLTDREHQDRCGIDARKVQYYRYHKCSFLGGETLRSQKKPRRTGGKWYQCRVTPSIEVDKINAGLQKAHEGDHDWLTDTDAEILSSVSKNVLHWMHKNGCLLLELEGRKLRTDHQWRYVGRSLQRIVVFFREDVLQLAKQRTQKQQDSCDWPILTEVQAKHGIPPTTVNYYRTHRCPALGNRTIDTQSVRRLTVGKLRMLRELTAYNPSDLQKLANWISTRNEEFEWPTSVEAANSIGRNSHLVRSWAKNGCPLLEGGRCIQSKTEWRPVGRNGKGMQVTVLAPQDVECICAVISESENPDPNWLTVREAAGASRFSESAIHQWVFGSCPAFDSRPINSKRGFRRIGLGTEIREVTLVDLADALHLRTWREGGHPLATPNPHTATSDPQPTPAIEVKDVPPASEVKRIFPVSVVRKTKPHKPKSGSRRGPKGKQKRNNTWLKWYEDEDSATFHSPAKIRDQWNSEHPEDLINLNTADAGLRTCFEIA